MNYDHDLTIPWLVALFSNNEISVTRMELWLFNIVKRLSAFELERVKTTS